MAAPQSEDTGINILALSLSRPAVFRRTHPQLRLRRLSAFQLRHLAMSHFSKHSHSIISITLQHCCMVPKVVVWGWLEEAAVMIVEETEVAAGRSNIRETTNFNLCLMLPTLCVAEVYNFISAQSSVSSVGSRDDGCEMAHTALATAACPPCGGSCTTRCFRCVGTPV